VQRSSETGGWPTSPAESITGLVTRWRRKQSGCPISRVLCEKWGRGAVCAEGFGCVPPPQRQRYSGCGGSDRNTPQRRAVSQSRYFLSRGVNLALLYNFWFLTRYGSFPGERDDRYPVSEITSQPVSNNGRRRGFRMHHALDHQIHAVGAPVLERIHGTMRRTTAGSGAKYIFLCHQTVR
jgi:hypothetical protein